MTMLVTRLDNRSLIRIAGEDAAAFLHGLFTCDIENLAPGMAAFGALLSPQGKILFDFFVLRREEGFLVDTDKSIADDFIKRLLFYRLRAKVDIGPLEDATRVFAIWPDNKEDQNANFDKDTLSHDSNGICTDDPRLKALGKRCYADKAPGNVLQSDLEAYDFHRITLGMPQGGIDFAYSEAFPHEALMDQFKGVDFAKGCYVGQEVVSRMQHRGTARKRFIKASCEGAMPDAGTEIMVDDKNVGFLTSTAGNIAIALVRLDRVGNALASNTPIQADGKNITLQIQDWAKFGWPGVGA